jgi:sugar O-acyltransferase (sialic acid O-acetyltransferase NeuD family)
MEIEKITILGYSDSYLTMLFDFSKNIEFEIIDNLNLYNHDRISNPNVTFTILKQFKFNKDKKYLYGSGKTDTRNKLKELFNIPFENLTTLICSNGFISKTTDVGNGSVINPNCTIAGKSKIGNNVFINRNVSIGHHTIIGDNTSINPSVSIAGNVSIGENCQIGIGAVILDNLKIGNNVIIGAGSVVTKDIPDNVVSYGVPSKVIKKNHVTYNNTTI